MAQLSDLQSIDKLQSELELYKRRLVRERSARKKAENLLENKALELYYAYQEVKKLNVRLEKKVNQRTETLTTLIKNLSTGILLEDENRYILLTNDRFRRIFKLNNPADELIGMNCNDMLGVVSSYFVDSRRFIDSTQSVIEKGVEIHGEIFEMKNGTILERDAVRIESDGQFFGLLWQYKDITEQQRVQKKIKDSEEKYRGIIENMELGMLEVDLEHNILRAYDWFCDMLGYTEQELIGQNAMDLFLPDEYRPVMEEQDDIRNEKKQSVYEVQMKRKDGKLIWVLISGAPFYDNKGNVVGSIGIHYDITKRKELEQELKNARVAAEHSREAEKQFLANMSHEIRNPINAITGLTNLLYDTKPTEDQLEHLNNIKYAADILLGLISGILDLSKIESGNLELANTSVNLKESFDALTQIISFKLQDKPVKIVQEFDDSIDFPVVADPTVINQIFLNLLGNSSKFTSEGEIKITSKLVEVIDGEATIQFAVSDTGIGIPQNKQQTIFESFQQADTETKLKYGGTGLGLSIVKKLVNAYHGDINVDSVPGEGSVFYFHLKFMVAENVSQEKKIVEFEPVESKKILVVEDNKINQQYLSGLLNKWGFEFNIAENGQIALNYLEQHEYDLILMDIRMPVMDGYETTIRLRNATHNPNHNVPIIALTASALVDEKERALATGMNHHMTKPFTPEQLAEGLSRFELLNATDKCEDTTFKYSNGLDVDYLDEFYQGDVERAAMMFNIFLNVMDKEVEQLKVCADQNDWKAFGSQAHKIKPNFAMVGLTEISLIMKAFEDTPNDVELQSEIPQKLKDFSEKFEKGRKIVENEVELMTRFLQAS